MNIQFFDRNFNPTQFQLDSIQPQTLTWRLPGGSDRARLRVSGSPAELQAFGERLRYGVEMRDDTGAVCWSGYIHGFELRYSGVLVKASLDDLYNRVAAWYTPSLPGSQGDGQTALTAWAEDAESMGVWGTKELKARAGFYSAAQAAALCERLLAKHKNPLCVFTPHFGHDDPPGQPQPAPDLPGSRGNGARTAPMRQTAEGLVCLLDVRGWYHTLDWVYYTCLGGWEGYITEGVGVAPVGNAAANTQAAQSFQLNGAAGWEADEVYIRLKKVNFPADALLMELCADSGGAPGTTLQSVSLTGANVPTTYRHTAFVLPNRQPLAAGTTYWIKVRRSGALDANNYYALQTNDGLGYPRGVFRLWNGSAWVARTPDSDLNFQVKGTRETTAQISDVYAAGCQFLNGLRVENPSTLWQAIYRSGERTARQELEALLAAGDAAGGELLAQVDHQRVLSVWSAPVQPQAGAPYVIEADGLLRRRGGEPAQPAETWLGQWVDFAPYLKPAGMVAAAPPQLIRRGVYTPGRGLAAG